MADPTLVNGQITDSVAQAHLGAVGGGPATAVASTLQAMAHAAALNMLNASQGTQQWTVLQQAATTLAVQEILSAAADTGKVGSEPGPLSSKAAKKGRTGS